MSLRDPALRASEIVRSLNKRLNQFRDMKYEMPKFHIKIRPYHRPRNCYLFNILKDSRHCTRLLRLLTYGFTSTVSIYR